jgi:hypothetical protein
MLRYTLSTLLIGISILAGLLGWIARERSVVANRLAICRELEERDIDVLWEGDVCSDPVELCFPGNKSRRIGFLRRWLGDKNADAVLIINLPAPRSAVEAFPEADIFLWD